MSPWVYTFALCLLSASSTRSVIQDSSVSPSSIFTYTFYELFYRFKVKMNSSLATHFSQHSQHLRPRRLWSCWRQISSHFFYSLGFSEISLIIQLISVWLTVSNFDSSSALCKQQVTNEYLFIWNEGTCGWEEIRKNYNRRSIWDYSIAFLPPHVPFQFFNKLK